MKKIFLIALAVAMCASLCSCDVSQIVGGMGDIGGNGGINNPAGGNGGNNGNNGGINNPEGDMGGTNGDLSEETVIGEGGFAYKIVPIMSTQDYEYMLVGLGECEKTDIVLPAKYNGISVTSVYYKAFADTDITSVAFEEGSSYLSIGSYAFENCQSLVSVDMTNNAYNLFLGDKVFAGCTSLEEVYVNEEVSNVGDLIFKGCENIKFNDYEGGKYIGTENNPYHVFVAPEEISASEITLNPDTHVIAAGAFRDCVNIREINLHKNIDYVGEYAFENCKDLQITFENFSEVFSYALEGAENVKLIFTYNYYRFSEKLLNNIFIVNSLSTDERFFEVICNDASFECNGLDIKNAPYDYNVVDSYVKKVLCHFEYFDELDGIFEKHIAPYEKMLLACYDGIITYSNGELVDIIYFDESDSEYVAPKCEPLEFSEYGDGYIVTGIGEVTALDIVVPETHLGKPVIGIGNNAFRYEKITSVTLPDTVKTIGECAFSGCYILKSVTLGNSVWEIENNAFSDTFALESINIPDTVTVIGPWAFRNSSISEITIPNGITYIEDGTFEGTQISEIVIPASVGYIDYRAFYRCEKLASITVDEENLTYKSIDGNLYDKDAKTLYKYAVGKADESFTVPDTVDSIDPFAFAYNKTLKSVALPENLLCIGLFAFENCSALESITVPDSTKLIIRSFYNCDSLKTVVIGKNVELLSSESFASCESLTDVRYNGSVEEWNAISEKEAGWCADSGVTEIICTDGKAEP